MTYDYTIDDAWKDGFEVCLARIMRYIPQYKFTEEDLRELADYIETTYTWRTRDDWYSMLRNSYIRMTPEMYEECKGSYSRSREEFKDKPGLLNILEENEKKLDEDWKKILECGMY